MAKKFVFRSNKYNVTHQDIQRGIEDRGYIDESYPNASETKATDKWYKYEAGRTDTNLFPSSSNNITRMQIHDAVNRLYDSLNIGQVNITVEKETSYNVGYNFNKQKVYNLVEEHLLRDPLNVMTFTKDPNQVILTLAGLSVKNILIYNGASDVTNATLPLLKTNIGEKVGHHKDGKFGRGLQGPFTEANVGGYKHRHQRIGKTLDRPERFQITDNGTSIVMSSPISQSSGLNYNIPYSRFSRESFVKSAINIMNVRASGSNALGNFTRNYEIISGLGRRNHNLAFVDQPQNFSAANIDNAYLSGATDRAMPNRTLLDGTYNKSVYVNKFGAPGEIKSTNPLNMDSDSEEYSPYNTINYRNFFLRTLLVNNLATASYFGGYISGAYGTTASYQKTQRNNRYIPVSGGTTFKLRPDNQFINYQIPARDGGFRWIKNAALTGNNPGLYVNGIDNDILFSTSSVVPNSFPTLPLGGGNSEILDSWTYYSSYPINLSSYGSSIYSSINLWSLISQYGLLYFNVKHNKIWGLSTKRQITNHDDKLITIQRNNNIFTDEIFKDGSKFKQPVNTKTSLISDKYSNVRAQYISGNIEEIISYPFAQNYASLMPNYYDAADNKIKNFYTDYRNIRYADKSKSIFKKLLDYDRFIKSKNFNGKKIKSIHYEEKLFPRGQNVFRDFARVRNSYTQKWNDTLNNRLTELTNSQGMVYSGTYTNPNSRFSSWPLDASTLYTFIGSVGRGNLLAVTDSSGELLQPDNYLNLYTSGYNDITVPDGTYFGARFGRNWNTNRPANVVHEQAGRGPYFNSYQQYYSDMKLLGQDCSVIPEYRISPKMDLYYSGNIGFYDDSFNALELTGTIIEDLSTAIATSSAFIEQRVNSDYVDVNPYINNELKEFKLNKIKFNVKGIKKLLPYEEFYPQTRMLKLASQFSSSYSPSFTLEGANATFRTVLASVYSPGIGFNSIKAGVGMPYSVVSNISGVRAGVNLYSYITSSIANASNLYYKLPWESILSPNSGYKKMTAQKLYDIDPNIQLISTASYSDEPINSSYDKSANNFYSEVVEFFKESGNLSSLNSKPSSEWHFPDLTKKYALDIVIKKTSEFMTYSSYENYGPKPYAYHIPPWNLMTVADATSSVYNSDTDWSANIAGQFSTPAYVKIIFDPSLLCSSNSDYLLQGNFKVGDILRNSTIEYYSYSSIDSITIPNTSSAIIQVEDLVNLFAASSDGASWKPTIKWECPTANLNFYGLQAKLTNSSGYDSGGTHAGNAIRGIWHQYAPIANNDKGLKFFVRDSSVNDTTLTGSLLDAVGFNKNEIKSIGQIASSKNISETLMILPFYTDNCGEDKYFDIDMEEFEKMYESGTGIIGDLTKISRNYVLPPQLDYIRFRANAATALAKEEYGVVKSPFLMFPIEFTSVLSKQDLADIWQGVMPSISTTAQVDYKEQEFDISSYLSEHNHKLPDNTRFKIFKIKQKAVTNYQQIIDRTAGNVYDDLSYGYNWPYDYCSLVEMAEVKAELIYEHDEKERKA